MNTSSVAKSLYSTIKDTFWILKQPPVFHGLMSIVFVVMAVLHFNTDKFWTFIMLSMLSSIIARIESK